MGWQGAMAGAGAALGQVADERIKMLDADRILAIQHQAEADKEARIQESDRANRVTENQYRIDSENRKVDQDKNFRQDNFDFNTDPARAQKMAETNLIAEKVKDTYSDDRFPTTLDHESQLFKAKTKPDSTLDIQEQQARIAHLTAQSSGRPQDGMSAGDARLLSAVNDEIEISKASLAEGNLTTGQSAKIKMGILDLEQRKQSLLPSMGGNHGKVQGNDYAELGSGSDKQEKKNEDAKPEAKVEPPNEARKSITETYSDIKSAYESLSPEYKKQFDNLSNTSTKGKLLSSQLSFLKSLRLIDQDVVDNVMGKGIIQRAKEASMVPAKNTRGYSKK